MAQPVDTLLSQLVINQLTRAQYDEALGQGLIKADELYLVTDDQTEAVSVVYNKAQSGLTATNVQDALDEIVEAIKAKIPMPPEGFGIKGQTLMSNGDSGTYWGVIEECSPSKMVELTLYASDWVNRRQSVRVPGMTGMQNGVIGFSRNISPESYDAAYLAGLRIESQEDNSLIFAIDGIVPEYNIPIWLILLG